MSNKDKLNEKHPDLIEKWQPLSKEDLLEAMCSEVLDLFDMMERISIFMEECTSMSNVTYTPEVIKKLIKDKKESDINDFCFLECEDVGDDEILNEIKKRAAMSAFN